MPLADNIDRYLGNTGGINLVTAGPACNVIAGSIQQDDFTATALLATIFWQAFTNSIAFNKVLVSISTTKLFSPLLDAVLDKSSEKIDMIVVRHGQGIWPRQDLLIFVHEMDLHETPVIIADVHDSMQKANVSTQELIYGWRRAAPRLPISARSTPIIRQRGGEAAQEMIQAQPFGIVIAPMPAIEYTAYQPSPAIEVQPQRGYRCTVGLYAHLQDGRSGYTTALHSIEDSKSSKVWIGGGICDVLDTDKSIITDSCFIEEQSYIPAVRRKQVNPLQGVAPAIGKKMSFENVYQGKIETYILGVDIGIPWAAQLPNQVKVYTEPVTVPGDSGTALIDEQSAIVVGFCFWRLVGPFAAGAWIWADSVFQAHNIVIH